MLPKEEVEKIARLAQLEFDQEELQGLAGELNSILAYVESLKSIDLKGIEPMSHVHGSTNVFRDDSSGAAPLSVEDLLKNAPDRSGRYIRVPIVIDHEE